MIPKLKKGCNTMKPLPGMKRIIAGLASLFLSGCLGMPETITPVKEFDINQYIGKWYEIVRLDHSFERSLEQVTAEYSLRDDGGVSVINRGYSTDKHTWKEASGNAYFVGTPDEGHLKVSFFGPFYSSYVIFELDQNDYQYAFISGMNTSYLWLLSRTPEVSEDVLSRFLKKAKDAGFNTDSLIYVNHK